MRGLVRAGLWDAGFYRRQVGEVGDLLRHYALAGRFAGVWPHPWFDPAWHAAREGVALAEAAGAFVRRGLGPRDALRMRQGAALGEAVPAGRVVVGIVTYDTPGWMLARVLRSVRIAGEGLDVEVVVLDNGGESGVEGVRLVESRGNVGFGAAQNRLMGLAFSEGAGHYLALNPDAALHPGALRGVVADVRGGGGAGAGGGAAVSGGAHQTV